MAQLKRRWQMLAVGLAVWWAGYLVFDLVPPIRVDDGRIYLLNAGFLGAAAPRCLATENWLGCFGLLMARINSIEIYCRAVIVLLAGAAVSRLHTHFSLQYTKIGVL